jgi:hypothetical protein
MPVPEIGPLRDRLCVLRCRLSYAQQRIRELEALLTLHRIVIPPSVTAVPPVSHDCFDGADVMDRVLEGLRTTGAKR